jgi:hypothetical protein
MINLFQCEFSLQVANHQRSASQGESVDLSEVESQVPSLSNSAAPSVVLDDMMEFHMDNLQVLNMEIVPSEILELDDLEVLPTLRILPPYTRLKEGETA